jgi:predicted DNA-binding transcriptional regulator YafY
VAKAAGRPQREPMERLVRLATALQQAGKVGLSSQRLVQVARFGGGADAVSQLGRELRHLRGLGWQIENIGKAGEEARYRMTTIDNRLRVRLTPGQQAALRRAALLADRNDLVERLGLEAADLPKELAAAMPTTGHDEALATVVNAVRMRRMLRYRYKGTERTVHPISARTQNSKWYLQGLEDGSDNVKWFVVSRMSEVVADEPDTATVPDGSRHTGLHPMTWEVDPPVDVTLRTPVEYAPDVRRWLNAPATEEEQDGTVEMVYRVTNRGALRCRLYELGLRVEVVGPLEVRNELLDELSLMAGEW